MPALLLLTAVILPGGCFRDEGVEPGLLASFRAAVGTGGDVRRVQSPSPTGFDMGFLPQEESAWDADHLLLAHTFLLSEGDTGEFLFTRENAVNFTRIADLLTDELDQVVHAYAFTPLPPGYLPRAVPHCDRIGREGRESEVFRGLLTGRTITSFRLVLGQNEIRRDSDGRYDWSLVYIWEVWGHGPPASSPARPFPWERVASFVAIAAVGLVIWAASRTRRSPPWRRKQPESGPEEADTPPR